MEYVMAGCGHVFICNVSKRLRSDDFLFIAPTPAFRTVEEKWKII